MDISHTESRARERILATARDLFYRNGYRATGINEIIRKSGVAKATFYAHFPSKESLAYAYVESMNLEENRALEESLERYPGPYEKLIGLVEFLIPWSSARWMTGMFTGSRTITASLFMRSALAAMRSWYRRRRSAMAGRTSTCRRGRRRG